MTKYIKDTIQFKLIVIAMILTLPILSIIFSIGPIQQHILNNQVRANPLGTCVVVGLKSHISGLGDGFTAFIYNASIIDGENVYLGYTIKFPIKQWSLVITSEKTCKDWLIKFQKNDNVFCHFNTDINEAYPIPISVWNSDSRAFMIISIISSSLLYICGICNIGIIIKKLNLCQDTTRCID